MEIDKNFTDNRFDKYNTLLDELREMIARKGKGYDVAQKMNDQFWEELGTHRERMLEQVGRMQKSESEEALAQELSNADSIYEATRTYLSKF